MINWQTKKFSEICDFQRGLTYSKKDEVDFSESVVLRSNNIDLISSSLNLDELRYINNEISVPNNKLVKKGSIIICTANGSKSHLGKIALIDKDYGYAFGGFMGQLIPRKEISSKYFFYILTSDLYKKHLAKISSGANINNLKFSDLSELETPLPPLPEQRRIVKILDEVFADVAKVKENAGKNLQNAKELFESYLQSVFAPPSLKLRTGKKSVGKDWEEKSLEELGQITSSKRIYKKEYVSDGVPFYRIKEIKELAHDKNITLELYISKKRYKEIKNIFGVPVIGDILMTAVGTIGEIYVVKNDDEFYFKDGNILWFKNFNSVDPYFLKFVLMSFVEQINKLSKGSAYSALTIEKIEKHKIFLPKTSLEQKSIVAKLDALSTETKKLETIYKQKLADLEELKKSALKKAFAGEL